MSGSQPAVTMVRPLLIAVGLALTVDRDSVGHVAVWNVGDALRKGLPTGVCHRNYSAIV